MAAFTIPNPIGRPGDPPIVFLEAMEGSQDCAISRAAQVYKAIWKVAWGSAEVAKIALLGRTTAVAAQTLGGVQVRPPYFSRLLPHAHPKAPWLFATDIMRTEGREPRGKDADGVASYKWAFLYVTYTKLFCNVLPDTDPAVTGSAPPWAGGASGLPAVPNEAGLARYVRRRRRGQLSYESNRVGSWQWLDLPAGAPNRNVGLPIPWAKRKVRLLLTWMGIPVKNLNEGYINDSVGTCNNADWAGYRIGSLLLNAAEWPDWYPIPGRDGFQVDVTFDITYYPLYMGGPNYFPDSQRGNSYHPVGNVISGATLAPERDWSPMFQPINV